MLAAWEDIKYQFNLNFIQHNRWRFITTGLGNTLLITLFSLLLGVAIGVVIAGVRSTYDKTADTARPSLGRKVFGFFNGLCKVYITVLYGNVITETAAAVQENVKQAVESCLSLNVTSVDVYVSGITFPKQ